MGTPRNPDRPTLGPRVGQLAQLLGVSFMPWQQHVLDVALERDGDRWAYQRIVCHVPRRAGKSTLTFLRQGHRAVTMPSSTVWYGAQSRKEGVDIWDQQISEHLLPHREQLRFTLRRSVGSESMRYANGSRVSLFTPADSALVGLATDDVTVDEARFHASARGLALEAGIRPTQATRDGQLWIVSSAGTFGMSDWLWSWLTRGRQAVEESVDSGLCFFDYSIPDDADPLDLDVVTAHHPAAGYTINREFLAAERDSMEAYDYAREYGGQWTKAVVEVIPAHDWQACADTRRSQPDTGQLTLAFATTVNRSHASIAAAWRDPAGKMHVAVLDHRPGIEWVQGRLVELRDRWKPKGIVFNAVGPAVSLADQLKRAKIRLIACHTPEYVVACGSLYEQIIARNLAHWGQQPLDDAVAGVGKRSLGDRWAWGHKASTQPIDTLEAVTLAAWGFDHRRATRKPIVVTS